MNAPTDNDDMCPACKSTKRTNPNIRFKINTKDYHRICETCIDRYYASGGTNTCPYPGCKNTFWKNAWRAQTFEDLKIEKEINIRQDVYGALNWNEDAFASKRAFDDFLEMREIFVMDLLGGGPNAKATRQKLNEYKEANGLTKEKTDNPATAKAKNKPSKKVDKDYPDRSGLVDGLKKIAQPEILPPYDPFQDMPVTKDYYTITANSETGYDQYKKDEVMSISGYDLRDALEESLTRAFAGFGVFIEDEKLKSTEVMTATATPAATDDAF